jgi:hypothetical protein
MPSPFPGMDPYLESQDWFPDLHGSLITLMKGALQQSLPESYYAQSSQRVWVEYTRRYIEPDVELVKSGRNPRKGARGAGLALAEPEAAAPLVVTVETVEHGPFNESFLEIRRRWGKGIQIVTSIEVLSPANKKVGNPGREKFLEKQRETLGSETHLVEIDLLRGGTHTLAVPKDLVTAKAGAFEYMVSIHRFNRPNEYLVFPRNDRTLHKSMSVLSTSRHDDCSGSTLQCLQTVRKFAFNPGSHAFGPIPGWILRESMIQHRQIHGVMAKSRDSVIKMLRKNSRKKWG